MLAAMPLAASDTSGWLMRLPLIRQPATAWAQPIRATTAQPWDTKGNRSFRLDHAETALNVHVRIAQIDAGNPEANCRSRHPRRGDLLHGPPLRIFYDARNSP